MQIPWPTWADLRTIGNSSAVRASIVVPVIGYLIVLNSTIAEYLRMHGIEPSNQQGLGWWDRLWTVKVYLIYFGLFFLGLGSAAYQWKCPHFVKKYSDWADYVAGVAAHMSDRQFQILAKVVGADYQRDLATVMGDREAVLQRRYLWAHYAQLSRQNPAWRIAITLLFAAGFILLAIPSLMTAVRVGLALLQVN